MKYKKPEMEIWEWEGVYGVITSSTDFEEGVTEPEPGMGIPAPEY